VWHRRETRREKAPGVSAYGLNPPANRLYPSGMIKPCSRWDFSRYLSAENSRWSVIRSPFEENLNSIHRRMRVHPALFYSLNAASTMVSTFSSLKCLMDAAPVGHATARAPQPLQSASWILETVTLSLMATSSGAP
jgi:hypothetical protein